MNLDPFRLSFDDNFPRYSDAPYIEILNLVDEFEGSDINLLNSIDGVRVLSLLLPVIKIKNYKTQVPFTVNVAELVELIVSLKCMEIREPEPWGQIREILTRLLAVQGIQLPTVSAYLHFCHPEHFPIVDKNIEAACEIPFSSHAERYTVDLPK